MELLGVGAAEAFLVLLVTLLVVGPQRFPQIARDGGRWYKIARRYAAEVMGDVRGAMEEIEQEMGSEGEDLGTELREVLSFGDEIKRDLSGDMQALQDDTNRAMRETDAGMRTPGEAASVAPAPVESDGTTPDGATPASPTSTPSPAAGVGGHSSPTGQRVTVAQIPAPKGTTGIDPAVPGPKPTGSTSTGSAPTTDASPEPPTDDPAPDEA